MSNKVKLNISTLALVILCCLITTISPRFGYGHYGVNENFQASPFLYQSTERKDGARIDRYKNREGVPMSLTYKTRFLGARTWTYGDNLSETATVMFDGGLKNSSDQIRDSWASYTGYDVVKNDAGGFFFLSYFLPMLLVIFGRWLYKTLSKKSIKAARITSIGIASIALLYAARLDTFLVVFR